MELKLLSISILMFFFSYQKNNKKVTITDFSKTYTDTIFPSKNENYAVMILKIKGNVNDTIEINFQGIKRKYFGIFTDDLTKDYYGGFYIPVTFNPLNATKGKIEMEYGIY